MRPHADCSHAQVRSFAKEGAACDKYAAAQGDCLRWGLKTASLEGFFFSLNGTAANSAVITVPWFGALKVWPRVLMLQPCLLRLLQALPLAGRAGGYAPCRGWMQLLGSLQHLCLDMQVSCRLHIAHGMLIAGKLGDCHSVLSEAGSTAARELFDAAAPLCVQVLQGKLTAGELSTFIILSLFVGGNIAGLASTIGQLVQVHLSSCSRVHLSSCSCFLPSSRLGDACQLGNAGAHHAWAALCTCWSQTCLPRTWQYLYLPCCGQLLLVSLVVSTQAWLRAGIGGQREGV